jgi:hypothetical protein
MKLIKLKLLCKTFEIEMERIGGSLNNAELVEKLIL